jgi:arylsulfatase A-like enzyme
MKPPDPSPPTKRRVYILEGGVAGLGFGVFDWLATGVTRAPFEMAMIVVGAGLVGGVAAGMIAALIGRRGVAFGLVATGTLALHGLSLVSKEIGATMLPRVSTTVVVLSLALITGLVVGRRFARAEKGSWTWGLLVLAAIHGASLVWFAVPHDPLFLCMSCALPPLVAGEWALSRRGARGMARTLVLAGVLLSLPVLLYDCASPSGDEGPADPPDAGPDSPCIVLVVVDTLRADHAFPDPDSRSGGESEGAFAQVAREGIRFDQAIASASWTLPSVASILTSLHPSQHGATTKRRPLSRHTRTLAEELRAAGYETAAFTGGAFVSSAFGFDQGFDTFEEDSEYRFTPFRVHVPLVWRLAKNRYRPLRPLLRQLQEFGGVELLRERVEGWLEERDPSRPFFLLVHSYQVHDYYIYHANSDDPLFATGGPPASLGRRLTVHPDELPHASKEEIEWFHRVYSERFARADLELGLLLDTLEEQVGSDRLVTILTSDHGEGFDLERGRVHHGGRLHDDLLRIPLVLRAPGRLPPARRITEQVRSVDIFPTILELARLPLPRGLAGRSLLPLLRGDAEPPREAWSEQHSDRRLLSLRSSQWKVLSTPDGEQRFQLDADPFEDHPTDDPLPENLIPLWSWAKSLLEMESAHEVAVDDATLHLLEALGY